MSESDTDSLVDDPRGGNGGGGAGCELCGAGCDIFRASSCQAFAYDPCAPCVPCPVFAAARSCCARRRRSSCAPSPCEPCAPCSPCCSPPPCAPAMPRCYSPPCCGSHQYELGKRLLRAAACGQTKGVRRLLCEGADANFVGVGGTTPLHRASAEAHPCVVTLLLNSGAHPSERTCSGLTALHLAAGNDFCGRCVAALLEAGADLGARTKCGRTPLHHAAIAGNEVAVRALVAAGASEIAEDDRGKTPFMVAKTVLIRRLLRNSCRKKRCCNCSYFRPPDCCCCDSHCAC